MAQKTLTETKKFILDFFETAKITERNEVMTIKDVPKDFETFVGKKAPYRLVFDFEKHNKIDNSELITKGSYFLSAIKDYMLNKGQTSILKWNLTKEVDITEHLKLGNCEITNIKKSKTYNFLPKFTFLSSFQYLNEKKQSMKSLFIKEGKILDITPKKLKDGIKSDIGSVDVSAEYDVAMIKLANVSRLFLESRNACISLSSNLFPPTVPLESNPY